MLIRMQAGEKISLEQIQAFLESAEEVQFTAERRVEVYSWVNETLRQRLMFGGSLAIAVLGLLFLDGYLARHVPAPPLDAGGTVRAWAMNGAISSSTKVTVE